ncbi:MAG: transporter substrate-binding domain-containing protein [Gammaproteobacteria bacterium]|nr:transporter substrate-binding domain-containing protein [Gammaproteobacteria bacterium]
MQVEVQYQAMPLSRLLKRLTNNELDAALILAKSAERQQLFIYPQQAFFITQGALTIRKSIPSDLNAFLKNQNYSVALSQQGYQSEQLSRFAGRFVMLSGDNVSVRAAEMLEKGRLDAFYEPDIYSLRHSIQRNAFGSELYILELPKDQVPLYTVFSRQGAEKYLQSYQQALQQQTKELGYIDYLTQWLTTQTSEAATKPQQQKHL